MYTTIYQLIKKKEKVCTDGSDNIFPDKGHYVCNILDFNTVTWRNFEKDSITQYPGYPMNVYYNLSID